MSSDKTHGSKKTNTARIVVIELLIATLVFLCIGFGVVGPGVFPHAKFWEHTSDAESALSDADTSGDEDLSTSIDSDSTESDNVDAASENVNDDADNSVVEEDVPDTITISSVGDCSLGKLQIHAYDGSFNSYYDQYGADYFLQNVRSIFEEDDLTIANLETVLSTSTAAVEKEFNIEGLPEYTSILTGSSVEVVGTGNNHILDYGEEGAEDTWNVLTEAGIPYAYNEKTVLYETENGHKVGIVASSLLNESRMQYFISGITELKAQGAEIVIAMPHWGVEKENYANETQVRLAHQLVDLGYNLVVGSHPHVVQGFEVYNGVMIAYSQGNFCYGGHHNPTDKDSMIYQQTFTFVDGVLQPTIDVHVVPCRISTTNSLNDFCPTPLTGEEGQTVIDHLNTYSAGYSDFQLDENGNYKN